MELLHNGTLKKRSALLAHYNDYLVANAKQAYEADMKAQHVSLFPETVEVTEMVEDEEVTKSVPNPDYIGYDEWMAETVVVTKAKKAVVDKTTGMETSPAVAEVTKLVREFVAPERVGVDELEEYLLTRKEYTRYMRDTIIATTASSKAFDADILARLNMLTALVLSNVMGVDNTQWKLADNSTQTVSKEELAEACYKALSEFGRLSGVVA